MPGACHFSSPRALGDYSEVWRHWNARMKRINQIIREHEMHILFETLDFLKHKRAAEPGQFSNI